MLGQGKAFLKARTGHRYGDLETSRWAWHSSKQSWGKTGTSSGPKTQREHWQEAGGISGMSTLCSIKISLVSGQFLFSFSGNTACNSQIFLKKKSSPKPPLNKGPHLLVSESNPVAHQTDTGQGMTETACFIGTLTPGQEPEIKRDSRLLPWGLGNRELGPTLLLPTGHSSSSR